MLAFIETYLDSLLLVGALLLLLVITYYTRRTQILTQDLIFEKKKDRKRDSVLKIIGEVCDPLLKEVRKFEEVLSAAEEGSFEYFPAGWSPEGGAWEDFLKENKGVAEDVKNYLDFKKQYKDSYGSIEDFLRREVREMRSRELKKALNQVIESENLDKEAEELLEDNSTGIARSILLKEGIEKGHSKEIFKRWKADFTFLRQKSEIEGDIEDLRGFAGEVSGGLPKRLEDRLEEVKKEYQEEYDILNTELEEK